MNNLNEWLDRNGITLLAREELASILMGDGVLQAHSGMSEASVSQRIVLAASKKGMRLFRNNVGACEDSTGRFIRFGLANISEQMNDQVKSADLIGITPVVVKSHHVGSTVGVFTSIECKKSDWKYTGKGREGAQQNWINIIRSLGGIAGFANHEGVIDEICTVKK